MKFESSRAKAIRKLDEFVEKNLSDYSKLRKKTGWVPKAKFDDALKDTINWYLEKIY